MNVNLVSLAQSIADTKGAQVVTAKDGDIIRIGKDSSLVGSELMTTVAMPVDLKGAEFLATLIPETFYKDSVSGTVYFFSIVSGLIGVKVNA